MIPVLVSGERIDSLLAASTFRENRGSGIEGLLADRAARCRDWDGIIQEVNKWPE